MKTFALSLCLGLLYPSLIAAKQDDNLSSFPSNTEINLLVTQASRAIDQYKVVVDQAEALLGKDAFEQDRMLFAHWTQMRKVLKENPQAFNSSVGFEAVLDLDDASRNAALCAHGAATRALKDIANGTVQQTSLILNLSQSCTDASTLLYTVSENASSLYKKFLAWQRDATGKAMEVVQKCQDVLKETTKRKQ